MVMFLYSFIWSINMQLKIPLYKQPKNSQLCGPVCLQMLYAYYKIPISFREVLKDVHVYKKGTYTSDLGISLLRHGFDVTLYFYDTRHFSPQCRGWSREEAIRTIETMLKIKKKNRQRLRRTLEFIKEGGKLKFDIVRINEIRKAIHSGNPPIICIDRKALYGKAEGVAGHFVIPVKITRNTITINDPSPFFGGVKAYNLNDFIFALYSWRGYVLFAKPNKFL